MYHVNSLVRLFNRGRHYCGKFVGFWGTLVLLLLLGCNVAASDVGARDAPPAAKLKVVATTTLLADLVGNVGGDRIEVTVLVPPGADVHSFRTAPAHSIAISEASLIVSNGAGLDDFLHPVLANAMQAEALEVVASMGLDSQPLKEMTFPDDKGHPCDAQSSHNHEPGSGDPHFWMDPLLAVHYVERIQEGLAQVDQANAQEYAANAEGYIQAVRDLHQEISHTLESISPQHRRLVTFHDAYGYFARRYRLEVSAFIPSDASEVTPGAIVAVLEQIKSEGVRAVFVEPQFGGEVLSQAARDAEVEVGTIFSLPNEQAPTYLDMMRANARSLAELLK